MLNKELKQTKRDFLGLGVLACIIILCFLSSIIKSINNNIISYDLTEASYAKVTPNGAAVHFDIYSIDSSTYEVIITPFTGTCEDYKKNVTHVPSNTGTIISKVPSGMNIPISFCIQNVNDTTTMKVEVIGKVNGDTALRTSKVIYDSLLKYIDNNNTSK